MRYYLFCFFLFVFETINLYGQEQVTVSTNEAVCRIECYSYGGGRKYTDHGSGTLVGVSGDKKRAMVLTAAHVVKGRTRATCFFDNVPGLKGKPFIGQIINYDGPTDQAAIHIYNPDGVSPVVIGYLGDGVVENGKFCGCGFSGGYKYECAIGNKIRAEGDYIQTGTAPVRGQSGGALFDANGCYCGIVSARDLPHSVGHSVNGSCIAASGKPFANFVKQSAYKCKVRFFRRLRNNQEICENCENPGVNSLNQYANPGNGGAGAGYGLAPGYQNITPSATSPAVPQTAQAAIPTQPIQIVQAKPLQAVPVQPVDPALAQYKAPVPDDLNEDQAIAKLAADLAKLNQDIARLTAATTQVAQTQQQPVPQQPAPQAQPQQPQYQVPPLEQGALGIETGQEGSVLDFARILREKHSRAKEEKAAEIAIEAYEQALLGESESNSKSEFEIRLDELERKLNGRAKASTEDIQPEDLLNRVPTVTMEVKYHDRTEKAEINLSAIAREKFGVNNTIIQPAKSWFE